MFRRCLILLLTLSLGANPQIVTAQSVENSREVLSLESLLEAGKLAQEAGNYEQAESLWRKAIFLDQDNAITYYNLGNSLYAQNKLDEAITAYRETIKLDPNYAPGYYNLANA